MKPAEIKTLRLVAEGKRTIKEIQEILGVKKQVVSDYLKTLKDKGVILETTDQRDKRKKIYTLNDNELVAIRLDEALNLIEGELNRAGEKLTDREKEILKDILLQSVRPAVLEDLKRGYIMTEEDVKESVLQYVNGAVLARIFVKELKFTDKQLKRTLKDILPASFKHVAGLAKTSEEFDAFVKKWIKTEYFMRNPATAVAAAFLQMVGKAKDLLKK